jgi:TIR domain
MPYTVEDRLNVFMSFASEDAGIANAIAATLRKAFPRDVEITTMNEFPLGENWRYLVDNSIAKTDVLVAVATGRLKPSHSVAQFEREMMLERQREGIQKAKGEGKFRSLSKRSQTTLCPQQMDRRCSFCNCDQR